MGSITHVSAKPDRRRAASWLFPCCLSLALVAPGCTQSQKDFGIRLSDLSATESQVGIRIEARQDIRLSGEARDALRNGVPLKIRVDMALQKSGQWSATQDESIFYEIQYLPLSDRFQLSGPLPDDQPRSFPRLRHIIAEMASIDWQLDAISDGPGQYNLSMRSQLDRGSMPGPMQLPMLFSSQWAHDSGWVSQEFEVKAKS